MFDDPDTFGNLAPPSPIRVILSDNSLVVFFYIVGMSVFERIMHKAFSTFMDLKLKTYPVLLG